MSFWQWLHQPVTLLDLIEIYIGWQFGRGIYHMVTEWRGQ